MQKKIIFLDGDGTLWYPKATKRTQKPHWIYHDPLTKDDYLSHLELTPGTKQALETLHERGALLAVISANPYAEKIAIREIKERLEYFELSHLFHSYHSSPGNDPSGKVAVIRAVLENLGLAKKDAVMIGDSYFYDYAAAKNAGIDAFFIENSVSKLPETMPENLQSIREVRDLVDILA